MVEPPGVPRRTVAPCASGSASVVDRIDLRQPAAHAGLRRRRARNGEGSGARDVLRDRRRRRDAGDDQCSDRDNRRDRHPYDTSVPHGVSSPWIRSSLSCGGPDAGELPLPTAPRSSPRSSRFASSGHTRAVTARAGKEPTLAVEHEPETGLVVRGEGLSARRPGHGPRQDHRRRAADSGRPGRRVPGRGRPARLGRRGHALGHGHRGQRQPRDARRPPPEPPALAKRKGPPGGGPFVVRSSRRPSGGRRP